MCIFNEVKQQSDVGFIVDAMFGNFAYLHNLYIVVELHTNPVWIHFESQPLPTRLWRLQINKKC